MEQARGELRHALKELRDLARGIHPAVLEQIGLGAAIETVAESMPLPVHVTIDTGRLPTAVEATTYFVICEGGAARHAHVALVDAVLRDQHRRLHEQAEAGAERDHERRRARRCTSACSSSTKTENTPRTSGRPRRCRWR
jgi:signal transduction histidine kinase